MLDMLTEQRAIALLRTIVGAAQQIAEPCTSLRLAIARALTVLGRFDNATVQYAELLKADKITPQLLQQLAEFICSHPPTLGLTTTLKDLANRRNNDRLPPLLLYALCRVFETEDYSEIVKYLEHLHPRQIKQPQFIFDIARLNFRFGNWDKAVKAAKKVLSFSPKHESAKSLLVSSYSFSGRLGKAARSIRALTKSHLPLPLSLGQLTAILEIATKKQKCQLLGEVIAAKSEVDKSHRIRYEDPDTLFHQAVQEIEERDKKINVSVTGGVFATVRPWDILVRSDWKFPHLMIQQLAGSQILHAFVPAEGPDYWRWQEVPVCLKDGQWLADENQLRFIPADFEPCGQFKLTTNKLFKQVEKELTYAYIQKELQ